MYHRFMQRHSFHTLPHSKIICIPVFLSRRIEDTQRIFLLYTQKYVLELALDKKIYIHTNNVVGSVRSRFADDNPKICICYGKSKRTQKILCMRKEKRNEGVTAGIYFSLLSLTVQKFLRIKSKVNSHFHIVSRTKM